MRRQEIVNAFSKRPRRREETGDTGCICHLWPAPTKLASPFWRFCGCRSPAQRKWNHRTIALADIRGGASPPAAAWRVTLPSPRQPRLLLLFISSGVPGRGFSPAAFVCRNDVIRHLYRLQSAALIKPLSYICGMWTN